MCVLQHLPRCAQAKFIIFYTEGLLLNLPQQVLATGSLSCPAHRRLVNGGLAFAALQSCSFAAAA